MKYNENFNKLKENYLFNELAIKVAKKRENSEATIIDLGVGDVKLPLFKCVTRAMKNACEELESLSSFKGYPPSQGYLFLREKIASEYSCLDASLSPDEIFITDGAKGQLGDVLELFGKGAKVLYLTPCYPAGAEANILYGNQVTYLSASEEDGFSPLPPYGKTFDVIYICSPNNPTGSALNFEQLSLWVNYALSVNAVIVFDGAYSCYASPNYPKTIYQISGAKKCAIEINSFSKSLGFTGVRCGFTVIPSELGDYNKLWKRRLGCRFNGVSYLSQRGAESVFCREGKEEVKKRINFYKTNVEILKIALKKLNLWYNNSISSPYVFARAPEGFSGSEFCNLLLDKLSIVATSGDGFLSGGEDYFRLSAFASRQEILLASDRLKNFKF